jgi:hypothetical protein
VTRRRCRDPYRRWTFQRRAVGVERWPVHRLIASAASPGGVPAAVAEAGLVADEDLAGAQDVAVRASGRRVGDPLAGRGLHQLACTVWELTTRHGLWFGPATWWEGGGAEGNKPKI